MSEVPLYCRNLAREVRVVNFERGKWLPDMSEVPL
jgi:hypothetical protein